MEDRLISRQPMGPIVLLAVAATMALAALSALVASPAVVLLLPGALAFLLLMRHAGLGLVAMAALSFTLPVTIGTGSNVLLTAPVLLIPAVLFGWVADGLRAGTLRLPRSATTLPLLLFLAGGLLSLLAGNAFWDPTVVRPANLLWVQLAQLAIFVLSGAIFLVAGELGTKGRWLEWATYTFLAVGGLSIALGYFAPAVPQSLGVPIVRQLNGSLFWLWLGAMAAGLLMHHRRLPWSARLGLLVLLGLEVYVLWGRQHQWISGWLPFTVAVVSAVWLRVWRRNRLVGVLVGALLIGLAAAVYPLVFDYVGGQREIELSWGGRQILYRAVLDLVERSPILGLGPASYRHYAYTRWLSMGAGRAVWVRPAVSSHNNYLDVYAQMGVVGLFFFLWFLIALTRTGWRLMGRFRDDFREGYVVGAMAGLVGTLVAMMLVDWFLPFVYNVGFPGLRTSALAWLFLGGLVALEQRSRSEEGA